MIAGLAAGFHGAGLFTLEKIHEFAHDGLVNAEPLLTGMSGNCIDARQPG